MSDINKAVDSWYESIKSQDINSNNRIEFLFVLFMRLKAMNICRKEFDDKAIFYVHSKLEVKYANNHLDLLAKQFSILDIKQAADVILNLEKVVEKVVEPEPEPEDDLERDVLEEEGYMEPPPIRLRQYDPKMVELLGIKDE